MDTAALKKFAQTARRSLMDQVSNKMKAVLAPDSLARRESGSAVAHLESLVKAKNQKYVIERVAYIWFNRLSALRFMDVNHYNPTGIVSPIAGQSQPEILAEAKVGHIDSEMVPTSTRQKVHDLLTNRIPSANPQAEAYRLLLVAVCNYWNQAMPFLFEKIADYTELLMPDDLLSDQSILAQLRSSMPAEDCADVEIIGWLYQFYISEKKDEVFEGLKENNKITPENIPAATQLFTPHWIVRYLVENTLGRLWMLNHPASKLISLMNYFIKPDESESQFLKIKSPEEIMICDPACGSGHMLVYAFDLLYAIYEEEGYDPSDIPALILTNNLFGIEIDERAGELAAFALTMKARSRQRRFFRQQIKPNICVLENVKFAPNEIQDYMKFVGRDLFTMQMQNTLYQFEEADNFGSLIQPDLTDVRSVIDFLKYKNVASDLFLNKTHNKVLKVLEQSEYLRTKYHVVVANPPYMGSGGMNDRLKAFIGKEYINSKSDLMTCFMDRCQSISLKGSLIGMINLPSWLFLGSFESFRYNLLSSTTIISLLHLGRGLFGSDFGCVAFIFQNLKNDRFMGIYRRLFEKQSEVSTVEELENRFINQNYGHFKLNQNEFLKLPGYPIGYWISPAMRKAFIESDSLENFAESRIGMATGRNNVYLRIWHEVSLKNIGFNVSSRPAAKESGKKWFPHAKGGEFRKWYGNCDYIVNWFNDGYELQTTFHPSGKRIWAHNFNLDQIFKPAICWTTVTISDTSFRYYPQGFLFDAAAGLCQPKRDEDIWFILGALNSRVSINAIKLLNPTVNLAPGYLNKIPLEKASANKATPIVKRCIDLAKSDWDSSETSWDFKTSPFLSQKASSDKLSDTYNNLRSHWESVNALLKNLEEENNRIFIELYNLQNEMKSDVLSSEITLNSNPFYRFKDSKSDADLESLFLSENIREFISYTVGCMFGRFSPDKPGLILASQGENIDDYLVQISTPTYMADDDNVIPILDGDWFADDIVERFHQFLRVTFGDEQFHENLQFIEKSIGKDIRNFFLKDFYNDHIRRYKKRPIYWLFSSPKGTFSALIYMHRYRPDTVSIVLNKYLREFKVKLSARMEYLNRVEVSANASKTEKTRAIKERETLKKNLEELDAWERDVLYPLALEQKEIDLDDGVKMNYPKFGAALKKILGLDAEED